MPVKGDLKVKSVLCKTSNVVRTNDGAVLLGIETVSIKLWCHVMGSSSCVAEKSKLCEICIQCFYY